MKRPPRLQNFSCSPKQLLTGFLAAGALAVVAISVGATFAQDDAVGEAGTFHVPSGLPALKYPENNAHSNERVELGKLLYFDKRLSSDNTISCASCHDPAKGWSNDADVATGVGGKKGGRNSPTIINSAYSGAQFWDGRAVSLEEQALGPIQNPIEMNMTLEAVVKKLKAIKGYEQPFQAAFGDAEITPERIGRAIAAYERTILSGDAPYDRFKAGDKTALNESATRGMKLFFGKAVCSSCHAGPNFTDNAYHNVGVGMDQPNPDKGRAAISGLEGDTGAFKTPTLREIARTGPYMHDGSQKTLLDVVKHYNKGGVDNPYLDEEIFPLKLSEQDMQDLVEFMKTGLSSESYPNHKAPKLPE